MGGDSGGGDDGCSFTCESVGVVPCIVGDGDAAIRAVLTGFIQNVLSEALCGLTDRSCVDSIWPRSHFATNATRAERDMSAEGILQLFGVACFDEVDDRIAELFKARRRHPVFDGADCGAGQAAFVKPGFKRFHPIIPRLLNPVRHLRVKYNKQCYMSRLYRNLRRSVLDTGTPWSIL